MVNELEVASHFFDKVFIVTKEMTSKISTAFLSNNSVIQIQVTQKERLKSRILNIYQLISPPVLRQLKEAYHGNVLCKEYLRLLYRHISDGHLFYKKALSIIRSESCPNDEVFAISTWFSIEALSVSLLKKRISSIRSYSFAHSFEINKERDRYMPFYFNRFKHDYLDGIFFISKTMVDIYRNDTLYLYDNYIDKFHVEYLGSKKLYQTDNPGRVDNFFVICSCSTVVPLKNLDLILDMLEVWDITPIKWIHFGGGVGLDVLSKRAQNIQDKNKIVKIDFRGVTPNEQVQYYYSTSHIDVFISVSSTEGLPVSLMEAISYGIPIIATDVGGTKEIVDNKHGILLSSSPSVDELAAAVKTIMKKSSQDIIEMRKQALLFWGERFNALSNMTSFYAKLIATVSNKLNSK